MQIHKPEEELEVLIFDRTKQPITPTAIGEKIIKQARVIIREVEKLQTIIDNKTGEFTGTLKIGVKPTIAPYLIPLFIKSFILKYPKIEFILMKLLLIKS
jgi:LysR family hydrogen peroxide-inducible transcriptional activator